MQAVNSLWQLKFRRAAGGVGNSAQDMAHGGRGAWFSLPHAISPMLNGSEGHYLPF